MAPKRGLLRVFRLQLLGPLLRWKAPSERRKIAIYKSRSIAALHCLLHLPPLGVAIILIIINCRHFFIGSKSSQLVGLQFAAKLHEILMQASIAEILFSIVRPQASRGYLPLGILLAPIHVSQISYLWSLELWSAIASQLMLLRWKKFCLVALIPLLILLAAIVGPSSGVAMIPRQAISAPIESIGKEIPVSMERLFPSSIDETYDLGMWVLRIYAFWQSCW